MKEGKKFMNNDQSFLGTEPVGRLLMRLAVPTVIAQLVNMLYNIVDRIYIGHMPGDGSLALTGVGVCMPIIMIVTAFAALIASGGAPRASIALGRGDRDTAERLLGNCFTLQIFISLTLTVILRLFGRSFLLAFGASENTIEYAVNYLNIYALGTLFVELTLGMNAFITAQGFATTGMLTVLIGAVCNIALDPLFIFVLKMGVRGAAVATIISQAVSAAWVLRFLTGKQTVLRLKRAYFRIDRPVLASAVGLGASPFVMQSTESLLTIAFNVSLQKYGGDAAVGAMTILTSVAQMVQLPLTGLAQGAQPILSYACGAKRPDRMKRVVQLNLAAAFVFAFSIWAVVQLAPHAVIHLFTADEALVSLTIWALRVYFALGFTNAFQTGFQQSFVALGEARISLFLALERKVFLLIPFILILPHFFADKLFAVFLAEPVADLLAAATTTTLFLIRFKQITRDMN